MNQEIIVNKDLKSLLKYGTESFPYMQCVDKINHFKNARINWHWHDEFEFIYVQKSPVICELDGKSFNISEGNGLFINGGVIHSFYTDDEGIMYSFVFSPHLISPPYTNIYEKYILPVIGSNCRYLLLNKENSWQKKILSVLRNNIEFSNDTEDCYELDIMLSVMTIWRILYPNISNIISENPDPAMLQLQKRMHKMLDFIHLHYREHIQVHQIAASASISQSEAQRCFHKTVHTTPNNYLIEYRLSAAHQLLLSTSRKVSDIASDVGFESTSYFDRVFKKKFGVSPKQMRSKHV